VSFRPAKARFIVLPVLVFLGLFAANPLLDPRLPEGHDIRFHLYRLVQLDSLVERGVFFSRWAPELAYGYGYPIFNYYAPAVYYVAEIFHLLGLSFTAALRATFALVLVGSALAMYAWIRDVFNPIAALVAASAYVAAPYMMILLVFRGALAELAALALLPAVLWATHRFIMRGCSLYGALGALLYALLILTHNITAMLFTVLLLGYGLCLAMDGWLRSAERTWGRIGAVLWRVTFVLGLGLGLSCFFWLPALAERNLVNIHQLYLPAALRFDANFVELSTVFGLPEPADPLLVYQTRPMSRLHLIAVASALLSIIGIQRLRGRHLQRTVVIFTFAGAVGSLFMTLPLSASIWQHVPLLPFIQFPWRFLGLGSFFVAVLAGSAAYGWSDRLTGRRLIRALVPLVLILLALYVIPWQYMRRYPLMVDLDMADSVQFERQTGSLGTTTMGEFLPRTVRALPDENSPTLFDKGQCLDQASLPPDAEILQADYGPLRYDVLLDSTTTFTAVFNTFAFPGWRAEIDGERVPITPTEPHGLISVKVPAGRHRLVVAFGTTPVRAWATGISIVTVLGLIGATLLKWLPTSIIDQTAERNPLTAELAWGALIAVIFALVFKLAYVDREGQQTLLRRTRFDGQSVAGVDHALTVNFADQIHLLGIDAPVRANSGSKPEITLYWSVPTSVDQEHSVGLTLVDERGIRYGTSDHQHPGGYPPTSRWKPEEYAQDPHEFRILPGTPPGTYTLQVSVYPYGQPDQALDVLNAEGAPIGREAMLVPLTVTRPKIPPTRKQMAPQTVVDVSLPAGVRLIGYDLPNATQDVGDYLPLALYWAAKTVPEIDLEIGLALRDADDAETALAAVPPVVGYPTSQWSAGDRWRGVHRLLLPPTLQSGEYQLVVTVPDIEPLMLGVVSVEAPEHVVESPPVAHEQTATFGDLVSLVGYELTPPEMITAGDVLSVRLVWYVHRETRTTYKSFIHLLDAEGRRIAGSDQVPGSWQRPTTGWISGEYIVDTHTIPVPRDLPLGTYRLQTGFYEEATSQRLMRPKGGDTVVLDATVDVRAP